MTTRTRNSLWVGIVIIVHGGLILACNSNIPRQQSVPQKNQLSVETTQIVELVKTFAEDQGPLGQEALRKLEGYPQPELLGVLRNLDRSLPAADKLHPQTAFLLCWLNQDYEINVKTIEAALSKSSPYQGFYADDAETLLSRLIQRGKKDLLKPLIQSASWADGALSEALGVTFSKELQQDPEQFLNQLSASPVNTREKVYALIKSSHSLSEADLKKLRTSLSSVPTTSSVHQIAKELLEHFDEKLRQ